MTTMHRAAVTSSVVNFSAEMRKSLSGTEVPTSICTSKLTALKKNHAGREYEKMGSFSILNKCLALRCPFFGLRRLFSSWAAFTCSLLIGGLYSVHKIGQTIMKHGVRVCMMYTGREVPSSSSCSIFHAWSMTCWMKDLHGGRPVSPILFSILGLNVNPLPPYCCRPVHFIRISFCRVASCWAYELNPEFINSKRFLNA